MLWRFIRVNRVWRKSVSTTLEWAALEMIQVDTPGFIRYLADHCERCPSLRKRVKNELYLIIVLLKELFVDFSTRSELI